ncbi:uncharacterized protein LOC125489347 [Plutella xylostella]|uniref:uncharacterized protein LOC125489347 n=1 Tax=Plutella xylostella TaxID=51655 RepID=UPI00203319E9|nr:uncharacterized protein LOC125489347 [Plutella xylostella]
MVLLSPSVGGLRRLIAVCERFADRNGLKYNAKKCEVMVFRVGRGPERIPPVYMYGSSIRVVDKFRYLGHVLTETLSDDADMERERRALAVRCNMLARRFAKCSKDCEGHVRRRDAGVPDYFAVLRLRAASFWDRVRSSSNELIAAVGDDIYGNGFIKHWLFMHQSGNKK